MIQNRPTQQFSWESGQSPEQFFSTRNVSGLKNFLRTENVAGTAGFTAIFRTSADATPRAVDGGQEAQVTFLAHHLLPALGRLKQPIAESPELLHDRLSL
ncbi:MAG: hypothetical protein F9B45_05055 [Phycisphaera sp. RhM]|nr:hypothetical protein [Phycisphaera sp. RhM]